jgi:hypothetical protein
MQRPLLRRGRLGARGGPLTLAAISGHCHSEGLAANPERLDIFDTLPRDAIGKLVNQDIRSQLIERSTTDITPLSRTPHQPSARTICSCRPTPTPGRLRARERRIRLRVAAIGQAYRATEMGVFWTVKKGRGRLAVRTYGSALRMVHTGSTAPYGPRISSMF